MSAQDLSQSSMLDLFQMEVDSQAQSLTAGLLALERDPVAADELERCMRAAHSLKGAALIVGVGAGVSVTHAMEECFVAAQQGRVALHQGHIDELLRGVDLLRQMARTGEQDMGCWDTQKLAEVEAFLDALKRVAARAAVGEDVETATVRADRPGPHDAGLTAAPAGAERGEAAQGEAAQGEVLRVTAENFAARRYVQT